MGYRILLVDTDERHAASVEQSLQRAGFDVIPAIDTPDRAALFEQVQPDLAMIDTTLPDDDAMRLCQELKQSEHGRRTPVVVLSPSEIHPAFNLQAFGCDVCCPRPENEDQLAALCTQIIETAQRFHASEQPGGPDWEPFGQVEEVATVVPESLRESLRELEEEERRYDTIAEASERGASVPGMDVIVEHLASAKGYRPENPRSAAEDDDAGQPTAEAETAVSAQATRLDASATSAAADAPTLAQPLQPTVDAAAAPGLDPIPLPTVDGSPTASPGDEPDTGLPVVPDGIETTTSAAADELLGMLENELEAAATTALERPDPRDMPPQASRLETDPYREATEISEHVDSLLDTGALGFGFTPQASLGNPQPSGRTVGPHDLLGIDPELVDWESAETAASEEPSPPLSASPAELPTTLPLESEQEQLAITQFEQAGSGRRWLWVWIVLALVLAGGALLWWLPASGTGRDAVSGGADAETSESLPAAPDLAPIDLIATPESLFDSFYAERRLYSSLEPNALQQMLHASFESFGQVGPATSVTSSPLVTTDVASATAPLYRGGPTSPHPPNPRREPAATAPSGQASPPARPGPTASAIPTAARGPERVERDGEARPTASSSEPLLAPPGPSPAVSLGSTAMRVGGFGSPTAARDSADNDTSTAIDRPADGTESEAERPSIGQRAGGNADAPIEATAIDIAASNHNEAPLFPDLIDLNPAPSRQSIDLSGVLANRARLDATDGERYARLAQQLEDRPSERVDPGALIDPPVQWASDLDEPIPAEPQGIVAPTLLTRPTPRLSEGAMRQAAVQPVVLRVRVDAGGQVQRIVIEQGKRDSPWTAAVLRAVEQARYAPARLHGEPVPSWITERFEF